MKKLSLAIIFICCTLALAAQDVIRVKYQGAKPTIRDFAWAFVQAVANIEECGDKPSDAIKSAMEKQRKGLPLENGETLVVDEKNGYILYEYRYDNVVDRMEMCYWNEADGKHKLFAFNNMASLIDDRPLRTETIGLTFFRYDNATKKMTYCNPPGFEVDYSSTYEFPRAGKNITVNKWNEDVIVEQKTLKWNGRRFSY